MLRKTLQRRFEHLMTVLAEQVESLPIENESWLETEREITAIEATATQAFHIAPIRDHVRHNFEHAYRTLQ